jgi:hypothetical protein
MITADNNEPPVSDWWYMTGIWDGTNMYLYVNGVLGNDQIDPPAPPGTDNLTDEGQGQTVFLPNTSVPFYIGSRSDGVDFFNGAMADVAFYNYALSYAQVTNHWSYAWLPSSVVSVPAGITNTEGSTVTLTPVVTGLPNSYQWFFNGSALSDGQNSPDGSAHYPNDVTNLSLVISETKPIDSGEYSLQIVNPVAGSVSPNIKVVITANTNPPGVAAVIPLGTPNSSGTTNSLVKVVYTTRVDPISGGVASHYTFTPPVTVSSVTLLGSGQYDVAAASLGADWREAILVTSGLTPGQKYTLSVNGVVDQSSTPVAIGANSTTITGPTYTGGVANWDYYYLGSASSTGVSSLTGNYNYPNAPQTNSTLTALDTSLITDNALNNNPIFGALGDNYGDVTSGWLTPTVTGSYTFFLWTDDGGEFDLSSDSNPANANMVAYESTAGSGFVETNATSAPLLDSNPINLTAGQAYYFQLLHVDGGGNDYAKVAWRISSDSTPAASLSPIPGTYLSAFAQGSAQIASAAVTNGVFTLSWSGGTIQGSTNLINWTNVPGNPNPLVVPVTNTTAGYYRIAQ